jgi:hypothetical protein
MLAILVATACAAPGRVGEGRCVELVPQHRRTALLYKHERWEGPVDDDEAIERTVWDHPDAERLATRLRRARTLSPIVTALGAGSIAGGGLIAIHGNATNRDRETIAGIAIIPVGVATAIALSLWEGALVTGTVDDFNAWARTNGCR